MVVVWPRFLIGSFDDKKMFKIKVKVRTIKKLDRIFILMLIFLFSCLLYAELKFLLNL
jgi:hypothetical protein